MIKPHHPVRVFLVSHSFLHGNQLSTFCSYNHTHTYHLHTKSLFFSPSSLSLLVFLQLLWFYLFTVSLMLFFLSSCTSTHILQPFHWQHMHRIIRCLCHIVQWPASAQGQPGVSGYSVPRCPPTIKTNNTCPVWHACTALSILIQ